MLRLIACLCVFAALVLTGCKADPATAEYWEKALSSQKKTKEKLRTLEELRESKHLDGKFLPMLHAHLGSEKQGEVKAAIARMLGELKDPSSVGPLSDALDLGTPDSAGNTANKEIAIALGHIGSPGATGTLSKLLKSRDNYTRIAAIEALGALKAKEAVPTLSEIATDETTEPFISKKAIQALGDIGDPAPVPALMKMMVRERKGMSFYVESSFALFQIGPRAADALLPVLKGEDKGFAAWTKEKDIKEAGVLAKSAQVLGDLCDPRAESALAQRLGYQNEYLDMKLVVRMQMADALGRMRAKDSVKALSGMVMEEEPTARSVYARALAEIGSREAIADLLKAAGKGSWEARESAIDAVAMLGDDRELPAFDKLLKEEDALSAAGCRAEPDAPGCNAPGEAAKAHKKAIEERKARLQAAGTCKQDPACWVKHLDGADQGVRARAAFEVGRSGKAAYVDELLKRVSDKNLDTRLAMIQGASWLVRDSKEAAKKASGALVAVDKQIDAERGKNEFVKVNEDLRRLAVTIRRQSP